MVSLPRRSDPAGVTDSIGFRSARCARPALAASRFRHVDMESPGGFLEDFDRFQDIFFALFAEAGQVAQLAFAGQFFDLLDRAGLEGFPEKRDFLGPRDCTPSKSENRFGIFLEEFLSQGVVAGLEDFLDVIGHALADAGQFHQFFADGWQVLRWIPAGCRGVARRARSCGSGRSWRRRFPAVARFPAGCGRLRDFPYAGPGAYWPRI